MAIQDQDSRLPGPNAKRPSSLNVLANLKKKKRKARDMEGTGNIYNTTHVRSLIKKEPGLPIDDSQIYRSRTNPTTSPIKQEPSIDDVLQGRDNDNDNSGEDTSRPLLGFDASMPTVKQEADSAEHIPRETSDIEDMTGSSGFTQPDVWDVSETEFHTSQAEEDSSDGESVGSAFSLGMEREESGEPNRPSRGHGNHYGDESDEVPSRRGSIQDSNSISRKRPNKPVANGSNTVEQDAPTRSIFHDHDSQARDESGEIPENGQHGRNKVTTAAGKPRQRAQPKNHITARNISRSWKTANAADKMLMKMKEKGCDWSEIRKAWEELTGECPAHSTLPTRYKRVKDNLTRMKPGDGQRLLDAAADVESQFLRAKWRLIAEAMERAGASKYSNAFIQKKYDELLRDPGKRGSLIDDESSDASESDPVPREHDVARLQHPGADSTMASAQARSEKSHVSSLANLAQSVITSGFGTSVLGDDESPGSGQRRRRGPPLEPKVAISREEAKYMARHKALNASNRAKPWEIIAQECGITAPLNDITEALERAGYVDARGSSREVDPDRSARISRSGERRQPRRTNGPHGGASKEI
ncbi:MAG: hypothetical protein ASARMPRED_003370 [Alectoria sarmentosa]|nr:MAG: hypothetical protein ASARMPRED_003370 [Alectoria sarmentosa]